MDKILHDPKDPKLWELWYIPYYGSCRILSINRSNDEKTTKKTHNLDRILLIAMIRTIFEEWRPAVRRTPARSESEGRAAKNGMLAADTSFMTTFRVRLGRRVGHQI